MTLVDPDLLKILACPTTKQPVKMADEALIAKLNTAQSSGKLKYADGEAAQEKLDGGLVREDGEVLYAIISEIPVLLPEKAISLAEFKN